MAEVLLTDPVMAPGVYDDIPAEAYHADPALSSTGARRLLECPAKFHHEQQFGRTPTRAMESGTAAHLAVLGVGPDIVIVEAANYRTKAAQETAEAARAEGAIPLLEHEYEQVQAMADVVRRHPIAGPLFAPGAGRAEVSLWWRDDAIGVDCRARLDWLRNPEPGHRLIVPDYKTTVDASPAGIAKAVANYGYHQQADHYLDGVKACGLAPDGAAWLFVFQEKAPPYVVTVAGLRPDAAEKAAARNRRARERYAECTATGRWPGYSDDIEYIGLPTWADIRDEEFL